MHHFTTGHNLFFMKIQFCVLVLSRCPCNLKIITETAKFSSVITFIVAVTCADGSYCALCLGCFFLAEGEAALFILAVLL